MTLYQAQSNRAHYQSQAVATASPAQLIMMLYDGALMAIRRSDNALTSDNPDLDIAHRELTRAQGIVGELSLSLDHDRGGSIAGSLAALYEFCLRELIAANTNKDPAPLKAVSTVISELRQAWEAVIATESVA